MPLGERILEGSSEVAQVRFRDQVAVMVVSEEPAHAFVVIDAKWLIAEPKENFWISPCCYLTSQGSEWRSANRPATC